MDNIRKLTQIASLLLLATGIAGIAATILFVFQMAYRPAEVPILDLVMSKAIIGGKLTEGTIAGSNFSITVSESLKTMLDILVTLMFASAAATASKIAIDAALALARLANGQQQATTLWSKILQGRPKRGTIAQDPHIYEKRQ